MKIAKLIIFCFLATSLNPIYAQNLPPAADSSSSIPLELFDANEEQMREALKLRDPFKRSSLTRSGSRRDIPDEPRTNFTRNVPSIEGVPLRAIRIVGVLLGEERRAIAKIIRSSLEGDGIEAPASENLGDESFLLREGMKIGENDAEIKAILPGGIVLVEKIRNVYDQDEYLETIIPISQQ